jgi:hypothetical protein
MKLDPEGNLVGTISISKTTGHGKAVGLLHFYVSSEAWIVEREWLSKGLELLLASTEPQSFLLPLVTRDGCAFSTQEPNFAEMSIISRQLLSAATGLEFKRDETQACGFTWEARDTKILRAGVQQFWTEHSDRATLPTWAKACGFQKEDRDRLGRWRPSESEEYIRTSKQTVTKIQKEVASTIKGAVGMDRLDEHETLEKLGEWLKEKGCTEDEVKEQLSVLNLWGDLGNILVPADVVEEEPVEMVGKGQLVVSLERGTRPQTLHCVGRCWRQPGIHFARYIILDREEILKPDPRVMVPYDRVCRDCYRDGKIVLSEGEEESSSDSSSA